MNAQPEAGAVSTCLILAFFSLSLITTYQSLSDAASVEFNANSVTSSYITMDTSTIDPDRLLISFSFRTTSNDSPLIYITGPTNQVLILELHRGLGDDRFKYYFRVKVTEGPERHGYVSILRDSDIEWNNVTLFMNSSHYNFTFNSARVTDKLKTPLMLGGKIYIGSPKLDLPQIKKTIFSGCMRDLDINGVKVFDMYRYGGPSYTYGGDVRDGCSLPTRMVTFTGRQSYVRYSLNVPANNETAVKIRFRTFDTDFSLLFLDFMEFGNFSISIRNNGTLHIEQWRNRRLFVRQYRTGIGQGDGMFRELYIMLDERQLDLRIGQFNITDRTFRGPVWLYDTVMYSLFLGGFPNSVGFEGCMKDVTLTSGEESIVDIESPDHQEVGAYFGYCAVYDRCKPNPCRSGECQRVRGYFNCNCTNTGYMGAVCQTPMYPQSCAFITFSPQETSKFVTIDVDGAGPLRPTDVLCSNQAGVEMSVQSGMQNIYARVDGFDSPGSFIGNITYLGIQEPELVGIIERSTSCQQFIEYRCVNSKLLVKPANSDIPYGFWVGRYGRRHFYWGGATPESQSCACKQNEQCIDGGVCNCNSGKPTYDNGYLSTAEHLPVLGVQFGDTGTTADSKYGEYLIGPLVCNGDSGLRNVVTFSRMNSTIHLNKDLLVTPITLWFQFKTTKSRSTLIHASGSDGQKLTIRIESPTQIHVELKQGFPSQSMLWVVPFKLNDDKWHTVYFEFNHKEAVFHIDNMTTKVATFDQWAVRRELWTNPPLVVGGNRDGSNQFLGCFRGLRINGEMIDLRKMVRDNMTSKGILEGCISPCITNPCLNSGICENKFYATYMCNCNATAYGGCYCGKAVGVRMASGASIIHRRERRIFEPEEPSEIELGIRTNASTAELMLVTGRNSEFLFLEINFAGTIQLSFNYNAQTLTLKSDRIVNDNKPHIVKLVVDRSIGQMILSVDGRDRAITIPRGGRLNTVNTILLGRTGPNEVGFVGCMYGLRYNGYPLVKSALRQPRPNYVHVDGYVTESDCMVTDEMIYIEPKQPKMSMEPEGRMPAYVENVQSVSEANYDIYTAKEVFVGEITHLTCNGMGHPKPKFDWLKDDMSIPCPHLVDDNNMILLPETMLEGTYRCSATNKWGLAMSDNIVVVKAMIDPAPRKQTQYSQIQEGSYVRIFCNNSIESRPPAEVYWDDHKLPYSDRIFRSPNGDLNFLWVKPEDSGTYTCGVSNPTLNLYRTIRDITLDVTPVRSDSFLESPKLVFFGQPEKPVELGETATFECIVRSRPVPSQSWHPEYFGDPPSVFVGARGRWLSLSNVTEIDKGPYECKIGATSFKNFTLNITSKPVWEEGLHPMMVYAGADVQLKCKARSLAGDAPPSEPQWFVNGTEILTDNELPDPSRYIFSWDRTVLNIMGASKYRDIQTFQCNVSNNVGYSYSSGYLNVLDPMVVRVAPSNSDITQGSIAVFEVEVEADPTANVIFSWHRNQIDVLPFMTQNTRYTELPKAISIINSGTKSMLKIDTYYIHEGEKKHFEGIYVCGVTDGITSFQREVELRIHPAPSSDGLRTTELVGVIVGSVCGGLLIISLVVLCCCFRKKNTSKQATITAYKHEKPSYKNRSYVN